MDFELAHPLRYAQPLAAGCAGAPRRRLRRRYGRGPWRTMKSVTQVRLRVGSVHKAEIHWYEGDGTGRREMKLKFPLLT